MLARFHTGRSLANIIGQIFNRPLPFVYTSAGKHYLIQDFMNYEKDFINLKFFKRIKIGSLGVDIRKHHHWHIGVL